MGICNATDTSVSPFPAGRGQECGQAPAGRPAVGLPAAAGAVEPEREKEQRKGRSRRVVKGFLPPLLNLLYKHGSISSRYRINTHLSFSSCNEILFLITL